MRRKARSHTIGDEPGRIGRPSQCLGIVEVARRSVGARARLSSFDPTARTMTLSSSTNASHFLVRRFARMIVCRYFQIADHAESAWAIGVCRLGLVARIVHDAARPTLVCDRHGDRAILIGIFECFERQAQRLIASAGSRRSARQPAFLHRMARVASACVHRFQQKRSRPRPSCDSETACLRASIRRVRRRHE